MEVGHVLRKGASTEHCLGEKGFASQAQEAGDMEEGIPCLKSVLSLEPGNEFNVQRCHGMEQNHCTSWPPLQKQSYRWLVALRPPEPLLLAIWNLSFLCPLLAETAF